MRGRGRRCNQLSGSQQRAQSPPVVPDELHRAGLRLTGHTNYLIIMKLSALFLALSFLLLAPVVATAHAPVEVIIDNGPVTVEITTDYTDRAEALEAAKEALSSDKFEIDGSMGERGFMTRRATDSDDIYYIGDISASERDGKVVLTIVLITFGEGDVNLEEVGERLRAALA